MGLKVENNLQKKCDIGYAIHLKKKHKILDWLKIKLQGSSMFLIKAQPYL